MSATLLGSAAAADPASATTEAIDTTGATLIVVLVASLSSSPVSPTDSKGNTWSPLNHADDGGIHTQMWVAYPPEDVLTDAAHTFTAAGAGEFPAIVVAAFSGTTTYDDAVNSAAAAAAAGTMSPGSCSTSEDGELVFTSLGFYTSGGAGLPLSIGSGFTIIDSIDYVPGTNFGGALAYLNQMTAGAVNPVWSGGFNEAGSTMGAVATDGGGGGGAMNNPICMVV